MKQQKIRCPGSWVRSEECNVAVAKSSHVQGGEISIARAESMPTGRPLEGRDAFFPHRFGKNLVENFFVTRVREVGDQ
jgi:hypothetical protein